MLWSKAKNVPDVEGTELASNDGIQQQDTIGTKSRTVDSKEEDYPGLKVVLPTVLSVCLTVFLTALVSFRDQSPEKGNYGV